MEENSGIYLIMNQVNGKGYVGQAVNIEERWKQHKYRLNGQYHGNKHLQNAWNKYGKDNFVFIILEKCAKSVLDQVEIFWIKFLDTYKNGYNNTEGGDKNPMDYEECRKKVSQPGKKNGMYGKGYLVAGSNNGMYNKKHTDDAKIKMKFGKKNTNQTGILNVSCRKDGCNLYRYYDDNGKYHETNCTWYAWGRMREVTGKSITFNGGRNAGQWAYNTTNCSKVALQDHCIAVNPNAAKGCGHVVFVEHVNSNTV